MIFLKDESVKATHRVLREQQPGWKPGDDLLPEVEEILQALCLRPYTGHESNTVASPTGRRIPKVRRMQLVDHPNDVPNYEITGAKFS